MKKGLIGVTLSLCGIYIIKTGSCVGAIVLGIGIYLIWVQNGEL